MNIDLFLTKILNDKNYSIKINNEINDIINLIKNGYNKDKISKKYNKNFGLLYEFAGSRIKIKNKFSNFNSIFMDYYSSMYSTPEIVGKFRSEKLKNNDIIDIGSGSGMQSIMFSFDSNVTGIEKDRSRYLMSNINKKVYHSGANFINSDFFELNYDYYNKIIFSDPLRPKTSNERTFSGLIPDPEIIIKKLNNIKGYVFDLPPQMKWSNIKLNGEKEYISINGNINRLTLYSNSISENNASAVMLPEKMQISGDPKDLNYNMENIKNDVYLYLPDISLIYSKLLYKIINEDFHLIYMDSKRYVFTGNENIKKFFGKKYNILSVTDKNNILKELKKLNANKIFLRFNIDTDEYYKIKNDIDKSLLGDKNIFIFKNFNSYILTELIE